MFLLKIFDAQGSLLLELKRPFADFSTAISFLKKTFEFHSALWKDKMTYNDKTGQGMGNFETKTAAYWTVPLVQLCIGMKYSNTLKWILIYHKASSFYDIIADGKYRPTNLGRQTWKSLIVGSSLQPNCNREGFNIRTWQLLRIGISSNNENDCNTNDSSLGIGKTSTYQRWARQRSCGNFARVGADNGDRDIATWGYIFVQ